MKTALKENCSILSGYAFKSILFNENEDGLPLIRIRDLKTNKPETYYSGVYSEEYIVNSGDLLVGMDGEFKAYRWKGPTSLLNQRVSKISAKNDAVDLFYISYLINNELKNIENRTGFTTVKHLSKSDIENIEIPLPDICIQNKIASALAEADTLIQKRKEAIAKLDELEKSYFSSLIRSSKSEVENQLGDFIVFMTSGSRGWAQYYTDAGEKFITIKNVSRGMLDFSNTTYVNAPKNKEAERTKVKAQDLLISITADLGRTAVVDEITAGIGAYINQHLCLVRLDIQKINPMFASFYLESEHGRRQFIMLDQVGVKSGLNFDAIKSLKIKLPNITLQNEFEEKIKAIRINKEQMKAQLTKLEENFQSLLHQAFTGRLQFRDSKVDEYALKR